jgi:hypothetical protein
MMNDRLDIVAPAVIVGQLCAVSGSKQPLEIAYSQRHNLLW